MPGTQAAQTTLVRTMGGSQFFSVHPRIPSLAFCSRLTEDARTDTRRSSSEKTENWRKGTEDKWDVRFSQASSVVPDECISCEPTALQPFDALEFVFAQICTSICNYWYSATWFNNPLYDVNEKFMVVVLNWTADWMEIIKIHWRLPVVSNLKLDESEINQ